MQNQPEYPEIGRHENKRQFVLGESRRDLLDELRSYGFGVQNEYFEECALDELQIILKGARWLNSHKDMDATTLTKTKKKSETAVVPSNDGTPNKNDNNPRFTEIDKVMLQTLITSNGRISSLALSRKLDVPLTTIQRRRKRLENEFLEFAYSLKLDKLSWRKASLLVSTNRGTTSAVGRELLSNSNVVTVSRALGEHTIDLHAEVLFKNNRELLNTIESIKSLEGVRDVIWTEPVEILGRNGTILQKVIQQL